MGSQARRQRRSRKNSTGTLDQVSTRFLWNQVPSYHETGAWNASKNGRSSGRKRIESAKVPLPLPLPLLPLKPYIPFAARHWKISPCLTTRMIRENDRLLEVHKQLQDKLEKRAEGFSFHILNLEIRKKSVWSKSMLLLLIIHVSRFRLSFIFHDRDWGA